MTRLRVVHAVPDTLRADSVITSTSLIPDQGVVAIDVSRELTPAADVIGSISHRIALGTAPKEIIFVSADAHHLEQYKVYI